ncbi:MAG: ABC transporter permease [Desulfobacteraceae bacterium]|jgi:tungstate transport system permease protein
MDYILSGLIQALELLFQGDPETFSAVKTTVLASSLSVAASMAIGAPLGFWLGYGRFPGRRPARVVVDTLLSLPTVVIGLLCYSFMTRRGPLGDWELLFTIPGMAVGQTILGLPIVIAMTATAVESLDQRLKQTLITLGADRRQILLTSLWEARFSLALAGAAAYGRIVSEVGISMMIGGNIKWYTRTITTAIALETGKGQFATGIALGLILMTVALLVNLAMVGLKRLSGTG